MLELLVTWFKKKKTEWAVMDAGIGNFSVIEFVARDGFVGD